MQLNLISRLILGYRSLFSHRFSIAAWTAHMGDDAKELSTHEGDIIIEGTEVDTSNGAKQVEVSPMGTPIADMKFEHQSFGHGASQILTE